AAALERAEKVGDRQAAVEFGIDMALLRKWRQRAKDAPPLPPADAGGELAAPDDLDALAAEARGAAAKARRRMHQALDAGRAADARALGQLMKDLTDRASRLTGDAHLEREHRQRIDAGDREQRREQVRIVRLLWRALVEQVLGAPWTQAADDAY